MGTYRGGGVVKCLSIKQPWADAIVHCGKDIENRSWPTSYRGPVLIHASKSDDLLWREGRFLSRYGACLPEQRRRGGIIGIAEIVDCVTESESPWFDGPFGFVLANTRPLPFTPLRGRLGLFNVPDDIVRQLGLAPAPPASEVST
jgi:hypothetical protein